MSILGSLTELTKVSEYASIIMYLKLYNQGEIKGEREMKQSAVVFLSFLFGGSLSAQDLREQFKYDSKPGLTSIQPAKRVADGKFWAVGAGLALSTVYDIETTQRALSRCSGNCREANPIAGLLITRNRPTAYTIGVALNSVAIYITYWQKRKGHKTWWISPVAVTGAHLTFGTANRRF